MPHDPALAHALLLARESRRGVARLPAGVGLPDGAAVDEGLVARLERERD